MNYIRSAATELEASGEYDDVRADREGFIGDGLVETFGSKIENPVLPSAFALLIDPRAARRKWELVAQ